jgi:phosphatidylserine/phosphatidylglycerophosphate/cardiolipin synthase-like enzyme
LYELKDKELVSLLTSQAARVEVILCTAGSNTDDTVWDTTNTNSRKALIDAGVTVHHRLFNNSSRIGHNKFGVLRDGHAKPIAVLTGSTNWTSTGMCGQSNNASFITQPKVAAQFQKQWDALLADTNLLAVQGDAASFSAPNKNVQGPILRQLNGAVLPSVKLGKGRAALWFSPNTKGTSKGTATPPDLEVLYSLMRKADNAILFACFQPSGQGKTSIIAEAIEIGMKDRSLLVFGSVSDPSAMPVSPDSKDRNADGKISQDEQANTFRDKNVQVVLATALGVKDLISAFARTEVLTTGKAIIHDKIVVIDPLSETNCVVAFGSHNLGFKASYCNDENMVIVRGHRDFALAYAVHVIDLWEHYRFRAIQVEMREQGKKPWDGLLKRDDGWQTQSLKSDRAMLANYFAGVLPPHPHHL